MLLTRRPGRTRNLRRGLGVVATPVGGSMVYSSNPIPRANYMRRRDPVSIPNPTPIGFFPVYPPTWGSGPARWRNPGWSGSGSPAQPMPAPWNQDGGWRRSGWQDGGGWDGGGGWSPTGSPYGSTPQNPNNSQALAAAQALLAVNPGLLSPQQYAMLQQNGLVSNTLPYSSVSQITPTTPIASPVTPAVDSSTMAAPSDIGSSLSASVGGLPLYLWLIIGGGGLFLLTKRR